MSGANLTRRALLAGTVASAGVAGFGPASAQLRVNVGRGTIEPMPIAVSDFAGDGQGAVDLGTRIAQVVSADLANSGLFRILDRRAYIQSPDAMRDVPRFGDWRQLNAQALVTGRVRGGGGPVTVEFRLWDVFAGGQLKGLRFETAEPQWRRIAHQIADAVYERLTGEKGYFDTRIAYIAESGPATRRVKRLALMDQDGANHSFLTDGRDLVLTPRFSTDAGRIAYLAFRGRKPRVYMRNIATGQDALIGDFGTMTFSPRFSPDGRSMLMTIMDGGNANIFVYDLVTRRATRVTSGSAIDTSPSYAPDGRQIVFNSDRGGSPQLYVMSAGGQGVRRVSFGNGRYGEPVWSPDGKTIAFSKLLSGYFHIGIMNPDGSDERLITRSYLDETPTWAPNGRVILFSRQDPRTDRRRLFSIDITGYNEREISTPLDASGPDWSPLLP